MSRQMTLRRFKWGISRMIIEAAGGNGKQHKLPVILPIWITGFDQVMPEHRGWPRGLPRLGAKLRVCVGEPVEPSEVERYLDAYQETDGASHKSMEQSAWEAGLASKLPNVPSSPPHTIFPSVAPLKPPEGGWASPEQTSPAATAAALDNPRKREIRSRLAGFLRMKLAELGARIRRDRGEEGEGELVHIASSEEESRKV